MTTRDIQAQLEDLYDEDVSPTFFSNVTDSVLVEVKEWQNHPRDPLYSIVSLDAISIKGRHEGHFMNKAVYLSIGIHTTSWVLNNPTDLKLSLKYIKL